MNRIFQAFVFFALLVVLPNPVDSATQVQNLFFNPPDCPISIVEVASLSKGWYIPCIVKYNYPATETSNTIISAKFNVLLFDTFDQLLLCEYGYSPIDSFRPGRLHSNEWTFYTDYADSLYRTIVIPAEIQYSDGSKWEPDAQAIRSWLTQQITVTSDTPIDLLIENRHHYFNPPDCPVTVITLEGYGHGYISAYYGYSAWSGSYVLPETPAGLSIGINYKVPGTMEDREIIAVNFKVWCFSRLGQFLGAYDAQDTSGPFVRERFIPAHWEFTSDKGLDTWRIVVFPSSIRFSDETMWTIDSGILCEWFSQQFVGAELINCQNLLNPHMQTLPSASNSFYNTEQCPITITQLVSEWREAEKGIWLRVDFECDENQGSPITAAKFGIVCLNAFSEVIYNADGYATYGPYLPGETIFIEWLGTQTVLGSTLSRTFVYPMEIMFEDGTSWHVDEQSVFDWFLTQIGSDVGRERIFPEESEQLQRYQTQTV